MYSPSDDFAVPDTPARAAVQGVTAPSGAAPTGNLSDTFVSLVNAIRTRESGGNPNAKSVQGATGSMQVMPGTFKQYARPGESYDNDEHRTNAGIRKLWDDFQHYGGDVQKTAAAYLGGRGAVGADGRIRNSGPDALGTTPAAYAAQVASRITSAPAAAPAPANRGADIGVSDDGRIYVNGQTFDSKDYGKAIEFARSGAFSTPGQGSLPRGFRPTQPGEVETYIENIVPTSNIGKSLRAGVENYKAGWNEILGMAQQLMGRTPAENTGIAAAERNKNYAGQVSALNQYPQTWDAAEGASGVAQLTIGKIAESAPYMVELIGPGLVGSVVKGIAMKGARVAAQEAMEVAGRAALARGASPEAARMAAEKVAEETLTLGARYAPQIAMMAGSYPSSVGDIAGNMREQNPTGGYDIPAAAALGAPYAALNLLGGGAAAVRGLTGQAIHGAVSTARGVPGRVARGMGAAAVTGAEEALGETGQEMVNQAGRMAVDPNASMFSPDAMARYRESAIIGGLVGGAMGGVGGAAQRAQQPFDMINPQPEAPAPLQLGYTPNVMRSNRPPPAGPRGPTDFVVDPSGVATPDAASQYAGVMPADQMGDMGTSSITGAQPNVMRPNRPGQPIEGPLSPTGEGTAQPGPAWEWSGGKRRRRGVAAPDIPTDAITGPGEQAPTEAGITGVTDEGIDLAPGKPARGVAATDVSAPVQEQQAAAKATTRGEQIKERALKNSERQRKYREARKGEPVSAAAEHPTAAEIKAEEKPAAPEDLGITDADLKDIEQALSAEKKMPSPDRAPPNKEMTPKQILDAHLSLRDNADLNNSIKRVEDLNVRLAGPGRYTVQGKKAAGVSPYARERAKAQGGVDRIQRDARERAAHIINITKHLDKLIAKYGIGGLNAVFAYRKKNNLDSQPKLGSKGKNETQAARNILLSNVWRLYRDGRFGDFAMTRGTAEDIRTRYEEGGNPEVLKSWFDGQHSMMQGANKNASKPVSGISALAYYMRMHGRTDLERMLGSRMYEIFKAMGADIDFQVFKGNSISFKKGKMTVEALGAFVTSGTEITHAGGKFVATKPTIVLSHAGANEETLPHEMLHAATVHVISNSAKMRAKFMPIVEALRKNPPKNASSGLQAIHAAATSTNDTTAVAELVAYGFTNAQFQDYLKTVKIEKPEGGSVARAITNAFEFFVNMIKLVIGAHGAKYSAMERLIEEGAHLFDAAEASRVTKTKNGQVFSHADILDFKKERARIALERIAKRRREELDDPVNMELRERDAQNARDELQRELQETQPSEFWAGDRIVNAKTKQVGTLVRQVVNRKDDTAKWLVKYDGAGPENTYVTDSDIGPARKRTQYDNSITEAWDKWKLDHPGKANRFYAENKAAWDELEMYLENDSISGAEFASMWAKDEQERIQRYLEADTNLRLFPFPLAQEVPKSAVGMFDPAVVEKASEAKFKSREKLVDMNIDAFLKLATPGHVKTKEAEVEAALDAGKKLESLPLLVAYQDETGNLVVDGNNNSRSKEINNHDGRHRARALQERGYTTMPVRLITNIRWSEQQDPEKFDYIQDWPKKIVGYDGHTIDMPVSRDEATNNYQGEPLAHTIPREDLTTGARYEDTLFGKPTPVRAEARALRDQSREKYNALREDAGKAPVTDWSKVPADSFTKDAANTELEPLAHAIPKTAAEAPAHSNFLNPVTVIEKAFKVVIENALPFLYKKGAGDKVKLEEYLDTQGAKLASNLIENHPTLSRVASGFIDKFGVPELFKGILDMGRKRVHNAGQIASSLWKDLRAFSEADQKLIHDYLASDGKLDISKLPQEQQDLLANVRDTAQDTVDRALEQGVLPAELKGVNITELIRWIDKNAARLAFGLKSTGQFKNWPKGYQQSVKSSMVFGLAETYQRGEVALPGADPTNPTYAYVAAGADLKQIEKDLGHKITLETDGRKWRVLSDKDRTKTMWAAIPYAQGRASMKATTYTDALVLTMHNLLHDAAANEFATNAVSAAAHDTSGSLVYSSREALVNDVGERYVIDDIDHPELKKLARTPGYWVKLGTGYGDLSNKYVPATVYSVITDVADKSPLFPGYKTFLNFWKKTKTAYSVPTHFNNVASSFVMMYMNDIPVSTLQQAWKIFAGRKDTMKESWRDFELSGALIASYSSAEIGSDFARKIQSAIDKAHFPDTGNGLLQMLHAIERTKAAMFASKWAGKAADGAVAMYENEDNVFRLAAFLEGKRRGLTKEQAGKFAADAMINYSIDARYINNLRATVMPFLAWPYRMVPMLIRTALFKPWKIATMASVIYGLNALAYAITGGDEDEERKRLPEYMRGNLFMMPGAPKALRLPLEIGGKPLYWNISNFMPLGDFTQESRTGLFGAAWPQGLMPTGPLTMAAELAFGFDSFTGKPLNAPTDTAPDKMANTMKAAWTAFSPNIPLPYNRQGDKIADLLREKHGVTGSEADWGTSILQLAGPKIMPVDMKERAAQAGIATAAIVHDYRTAIAKIAREEMKYGSPDMDKVREKQAELIADMLEKIKKAKGDE